MHCDMHIQCPSHHPPPACRNERHLLYTAMCMAAALEGTGAAATLASLGRWAAKRPAVIKTLCKKMPNLLGEHPEVCWCLCILLCFRVTWHGCCVEHISHMPRGS